MFEDVISNYKMMSIQDKRVANIDELKFIIAFLQKICDDNNIKYREVKSKEILDIQQNGNGTESDYLEASFVYISLLKELVGAYLNKTL